MCLAMDNARSPMINGARMPTRQLGQSTLEITPMGLGAWAIGGAWRFGWGPQDDADSLQRSGGRSSVA